MTIAITLLIVIAVIALIWFFIEFKRFRHKVTALVLIGLVVFIYIGLMASLSGKNIDFTTPSGWGEAGGLYLSWLSGVFTKVKTVTAYAIGLNWSEKVNSSAEEETDKTNSPPQNLSEESIWDKLK